MRPMSALMVLAACAMLPLPAAAQSEPSETTETFGSWTVRCRKAPGEPKACEIVHTVQGQGGSAVAQIAIGTPPGVGAKPLLVIQAPLGVLVTKPAMLASETGSVALEAAFQTCLQMGCLAQAEADPAKLDTLARAKSAKMTVTDRSGRAVELAVPLNGMTAALERLRKG